MDRRSEAEHRESFLQTNASLAIEAMVMTAEDLALQECVIRDELPHADYPKRVSSVSRRLC
jgi:hypothetical protein